MKLSLKNRLLLFSITIISFVVLAATSMMYTLNDIEDRFDNYKQIAVKNKVATLEISKDLNYISRCSRDIMLGNDYNKNLDKIESRKKEIEKNFDILEKNIIDIEKNRKIKELISNSKKSTFNFINSVQDKMLRLKQMREEDFHLIYKEYKKEATPLAIESRENYNQLKSSFDEYFINISERFNEEIKIQRDIIGSSSLIFILLIVISMLIAFKNILKGLDTKKSLQKTQKLLLQYKNAIDKTNIVSKTDIKGNITYVNEQFCRVSQYTKEELLNNSHNVIRHENMDKKTFEDLWQTISNNHVWHGIIKNKKKDRSSYFVDTTIFPILDEKGVIEEYIAIRKDITELIELNQKLKSSQEEILTRIGMIAETKSKETSNHVKRVAEYCKILALGYGLDSKEIEVLYAASALHDMGKVATPDYILNKAGKLTKEEFEIMKKHSKDGYMMLRDSSNEIIKAGAIIAYQHHEKYDGSGYPRGISKDNIHIYARITAIADVFDALGSKRSYKDAWSLQDIIDFINSQNGIHFDPKLVKIFNEKIDDFLFIRKKFKSDY